jgi:hypothetical protein
MAVCLGGIHHTRMQRGDLIVLREVESPALGQNRDGVKEQGKIRRCEAMFKLVSHFGEIILTKALLLLCYETEISDAQKN